MKSKNKKKEYTKKQILELSIAFEKDPVTIKRWIQNENDILTSDKAKEVLLSLANK